MLEEIDKSSKSVGTRPHITCRYSKDHIKHTYGCSHFSPILLAIQRQSDSFAKFRFLFGPVNSNKYFVKLSSHSASEICEQNPILLDA